MLTKDRIKASDELVKKVASGWESCETVAHIRFMSKYKDLFLKKYKLSIPQHDILINSINKLITKKEGERDALLIKCKNGIKINPERQI